MMEKNLKENPEEKLEKKLEEDSEEDLDMEPYFKAWAAYKKRLATIPMPEVDLKQLKKWGRRSPRRKLLRREVACLIAGIVLFVFFLCHYTKGMAMPVPYIITLLLCVLCIADSLYALRLIALTNPLTASIPDMLINCDRLRLYQKIELMAVIGVVIPLSVLFVSPVVEWIWNSINLYSIWISDTFSFFIILIAVISGLLVSIYMFRSNLDGIKDSIKEIRENRDFFKK
ncbi:MAG: hypothetical protein IKO59_06700 [Bacteroidales bacterium]|nr:hypothetical protein [Bacteroidales bacterium]